MAADADVLIVGGGPVGSTLALALGALGRRAVLLDATAGASDDARCIALSHGSRLILERIEAFRHLHGLTPVETIHVSQRGGFGRVLLTAAEAGVPALGYTVGYSSLRAALEQALLRCTPVTSVRSARVSQVQSGQEAAKVHYTLASGTGELSAKLVILADGGGLAEDLAVQHVHRYGQSALTATVKCDRAHEGRAYERFTPTGPAALLPFGAHYALIWTTHPAEAEWLRHLPEREFLSALQVHFGDRTGRFLSSSPRSVFPLTLRVARPLPATRRTVLIGNAAQALHPVAGQGLNLGLRDAWELARCIGAYASDPGSKALITLFHRTRRTDRSSSIFLTDALVRVFGLNHPALRAARGCGLTLLDSVLPAKRAVMSQMMFGA